jgi:hypothetical protein
MRFKTYHRCVWHWLETQPIATQVAHAQGRLAYYIEQGNETRMRVPEAEWLEGTRWCSGCQWFVPLFYARGSRCRACASKAAHTSHLKRTYGITEDDYQRLLEHQGGVCAICGQVPRAKRLAVDHDHVTGKVRGLLCANDEFGCNVTLRRLLNDAGMAWRAVRYVEHPPWDRIQNSEGPREA